MNEVICDPSGIYETPQASTFARPAPWLVDLLVGDHRSDTGITVNWKNALSLSAAWYCVNTIAGDIAQLPLGLYSRGQERRPEEDFTHPAGKVMRNPIDGPIGAFQFRYMMQNHALVQGNGRAFIVRNGRQEPMAFVPLPAEHTTTVSIYREDTEIREKWHVLFPEKGAPIPLPDRDVLHIFRFSWDGYNGVAPLELLKNSFGLGISGERYAARFYKQGGAPSFVLEAPPGVFRDEAKAQEFLRKFNEYHAGLDNAQRVGMLREGIKAHVLGISHKDAQMLEQREFSVRDIMRVFGIPMIPGVSDSQSYNTLEQLNRAYLLHCLGPWQRVWEEECARKLLTEAEKKREAYFFMFDSWELVKPDATQRAEMLSKLVSSMIITPNEAREWEGLPPLPGGDMLRNPAITPEPAGGGTEDDDSDDMMDRERALVAAKLQPLVSAEIRRVREMAGKARNFVDWTEAFYARHLLRLTEAVTALGGSEWMAAEFVEHSKYQILEAAGGCQKTELLARIEQVTAAWNLRTDELAARILEASD